MLDSLLAARTLAQIAARNASALTDATKRALTDQRAAPLGTITATGANAGAVFDIGVIGATGAVNRAVIAKGHNLAAETVEIIVSNTAGIPVATVLDSLTAPGSGAVIDFDFAAGATNRYWGFQVPTSSAETFTLGEFAIGIRSQLSSSAAVAPDWDQGFADTVREQEFPGRTSVLTLAPARRRLSLTVANVVNGSADALLLDSIVAQGRERPFWYWPPDDSIGPLLVRLEAPATVRQDFPAPLVSVRYTYSMAFREQLT